MDVIVPDDQLSLAIGRKWPERAARRAAHRTGSIDIKSESKMREAARWLSEAVSVIEGCGDPEAELLLQQGITSLEDLGECSVELLTSMPGISEEGAELVKQRAVELIAKKNEEEEQARLEAEQAEAAAAAAAQSEAESAPSAEAPGEAPAASEEAPAANDEEAPKAD